MALLKNKIIKEDENDITLDTNDFLRPSLKQIRNSILEIKEYFSSARGIRAVPATFESPSKEIVGNLLHCLKEDGFFYLTDILNGKKLSKSFEKGFILLVDSLALGFDFPLDKKHDNVQCDALILVPHQPVLVLTFTSEDGDPKGARLYNSSVVGGVTDCLGRFMDETVNVVFGVLNSKDLKDVCKFQEKVMRLARRCSQFVTENSLSMNPQKYEKTCTALCAGLSEIKSWHKGTGENKDKCITFLTKDQCIILVENINKREVNVTSNPGCGATTLMLEVARRLSRLGNTLLVCKSEEERYRLRSITSATIAAQQVHQTDMSQYDHIVDGTGSLDCQRNKRLWRFVRHQAEDCVDIAEDLIPFEKTAAGGTIRMSLSEGIYHLLNTVADAELQGKRQEISSKTAWDNFHFLDEGLQILEKHKDNREKLISLLTFTHRQWKVDHLIAELPALKLLDTWIKRHFDLFVSVAALNVPTKKSPPLSDEDEDVEVEGKQHSQMFEEFKKALRGREDMFPVLKTAVQEDNKKIHYYQMKADYLQQEMSMESGIGIWELKHRKRKLPSTERNENESTKKIPKKHSNKESMGHVEQFAVPVGKMTSDTLPHLDEDFEAKLVITKQSLPDIQQTKEDLLQLQKDFVGQEEELRKHTAMDRNEWKYKLDVLSKEIPVLSTHSLITEVIGEEIIPALANQSITQDILKDAATNTSDQRLGRENRVHQLRQFQYGKLTQRNILNMLDNVIRENMEKLFHCQDKAINLERVYGSPVYIVTEYGSPHSSLVSCPVMKLDKSRVNTDEWHVSTHGGTLVNRPDRGQYNTDRFRVYCGTCSSLPIPLPPSPSTLTAPRYWESHTRLRVTVRVYGQTLLEMGICGVGEVDTGHWVSEQTRSSWAVCVVVCDTHRHRYCTQVWGEGRQVGGCYNTKSITHITTVVYKYGVVLDVERGRVAFLDLDRDIVIEKMDVRITQPLRAMFGVRPLPVSDIQMRLVSGGEIAMTDNKQSLIYKALSV